jgi:ABC-type antimicrobial peptide transport system permease subunit
MRTRTPIQPPRWAQKLLSWYCRAELLEDLEGDLTEYFQRNLKNKGPSRARLNYVIDVFKFIRPYTLRKPEFLNLLIQWLMIGSYIKTSGRSIIRNKLFSSINIIGLSISMSVGLLMISMLKDLYSYDRFHEKHARIYRLISQHQYNGDKSQSFRATTSLSNAKTIEASISGIEDVAVLQRGFSGDISNGEKVIPLSGYWASASISDVFSFKLLRGNPATALKAPYSVILTEASAKKIFGQEDVLGKTVTFKNGDGYTITGIMQDIPSFSHVKFEMLGSLSTRELLRKDNPAEIALDDNNNQTWAYLLLAPGADPGVLEKNLNTLAAIEDPDKKNWHIERALQPMDDIVTGENLSNQIGQTMGSTVIWIFSALTFIVILSACLNYTNLSIARSFKRAREIGIRKTIGALRGHVIAQFIVESVVIALLALGLSFVLFLLIRPHFLSMESSLQELLVLELTPSLVFLFILFAIFVGISAGFFPALFFARINTIQVLKNISAMSVFKGITARKALIIFQYSISIIAITSTIILYRQYKHFIAYNLGFTTENIINIRVKSDKAELLKKELLEMAEVKGISQSALISGIGHYWDTMMKNPLHPQDSATVFFNIIDEHYLPLHDHTFIAGRNFTPRAGTAPETEVIVNQAVLKRLNISPENPRNAIDEMIRVAGKDLRIVGVLSDFEYGKANSRAPKEVVMRYSNEHNGCLNVKVLSGDWPATLARIESAGKKIDPAHPIYPKFYSEEIEEGFRGLKASMKVGGFMAVLIIVVASIGLLGMVVFTTETRLKEISIRKVHGASETRLLYLLSKGFLFLLAVATMIGLPVTYLFFDKVLLPQVFHHAPIAISDMVMGFTAVAIVALMMIGSQTLKAARTNPAEVLKTE